MGISRRNPRGNFNWQSRIIKKLAIGCGKLNVPFDCDALAPVLQFSGTTICKSVGNRTVTVTNTQPNQATQTFYEWYEGGPGGTLVYSSFGPSNLVLSLAQQIVGTMQYWIVATNQFGCVTEQMLNVYVFNRPVISTTIVQTTDPCVASANPSGFSSNGSVTVTNTSPSINALYYIYTITYGASSVNPGYTASVNTTSTSYVWTGLCDGDYTVNIQIWGDINGVPTLICAAVQNVARIGPFILSFDNIANVPVTNPADKAEWEALQFYVSFPDLGFSSVSVVGNDVYFYPANPNQGVIKEPVSNPLWDQKIVGVEDKAGWISLIDNNAFDSTAGGLVSVKLRSVVVIRDYAFANTGVFVADFPLCTTLQQFAFANSQITDANFPMLTLIQNNAFASTSNLSFINFPLVTFINTEAFRYSGLPVAYFPSVITVGNLAFANCLSLTDVDMPVATTAQDSAFGVTQTLSNINMPLLQQTGLDCFAGSTAFPALYNTVLTTVNLPSLLTAGPGSFQYIPNLSIVNLPSAISISNLCFRNTDLTDIYIPSCVLLGATSGDNFVFSAISGNIINATVNSVLQTNNAGGLDGDLAALNAANTVTFTWV